MKRKKQVVIQRRIDEVMHEEFEKLITESTKDPLLRLIREGRIKSLSLEEIKGYLLGEKSNE